MKSQIESNINQFVILSEIQSKKEGTVYLIKDQIDDSKYVQKIFKSEQSKQRVILNINRISKISNHPGILPLICYNDTPFPTIITPYMPNGTLHESILQSQIENSDHKVLTDTNKFLILIGIANAMRFLDIHHILFDDIDTSSIYLDENLLPKISFTKLLIQNEEKIDYIQIYPKTIFSFSLIVYELLTGTKPIIEDFDSYEKSDARPDLSQINSEWICDFLRRCWSTMSLLRPRFVDILNELNGHITDFGEIELETVKRYQTKIDEYFKNYIEKIEIYSKEDDMYSIFAYGKMLYHGYGVSVNKERAAQCFKKASELGYVFSMYNYAVLLENGDGVCKDEEEAIILYKEVAKQGHPSSLCNYAHLLEEKNENKEAVKMYKIAADRGCIHALFNYANMLENGNGIQMNVEEAAHYYKIAAESGHLFSMYNYASLLFRGKFVEMDKKKAALFFKIAADHGQVESMFNYGIMLYNGYGIDCDKKLAACYFKKAADKGNSMAMHNYAILLNNGEGVKMNRREASRYFKMAIDKGHAKSKKFYNNLKKYTKYRM
ncbi:hypothetical protein M9Y10_000501 [Tritrichomonas musculus]|uniref:Protein kinase domain-containing protein n=1 Tax=Tritrichomonas musculus TaxID=1915356 RepID=A0ABR2L4E6_9EUKA